MMTGDRNQIQATDSGGAHRGRRVLLDLLTRLEGQSLGAHCGARAVVA